LAKLSQTMVLSQAMVRPWRMFLWTMELLWWKALRHVRASLLLRMVQWVMELSMRMEHSRIGLKELVTLMVLKWLEAMVQWIQEALLEQSHSSVRRKLWEEGLLEQNQKRRQGTGFHVRAIGEKGLTMEEGTGLDDTFGMGNMKGASEGHWNLITPSVVAVVQDPILNPYAY
jgi:hypothetical protein